MAAAQLGATRCYAPFVALGLGALRATLESVDQEGGNSVRWPYPCSAWECCWRGGAVGFRGADPAKL